MGSQFALSGIPSLAPRLTQHKINSASLHFFLVRRGRRVGLYQEKPPRFDLSGFYQIVSHALRPLHGKLSQVVVRYLGIGQYQFLHLGRRQVFGQTNSVPRLREFLSSIGEREIFGILVRFHFDRLKRGCGFFLVQPAQLLGCDFVFKLALL